LDGVDFNWEWPAEEQSNSDPNSFPTDGANFVATVQLLKQMFAADPTPRTISVTAPGGSYYALNYPYAGLAQYANWIIVEDYDMNGYNPSQWGKAFQQ
jgi:GH18 family chitinase